MSPRPPSPHSGSAAEAEKCADADGEYVASRVRGGLHVQLPCSILVADIHLACIVYEEHLVDGHLHKGDFVATLPARYNFEDDRSSGVKTYMQ